MEENFGPDFITVTDEDGNDFELDRITMAFYTPLWPCGPV